MFGLITAVTIGRNQVNIFAPDGGTQSIAAIPLNSFTTDEVNAVVFLFAL